jgi:hypothetical protein
MRIKTSSRRPNDFLAWQPEKNGIFLVRTAYRIGLRLVQQETTIGASSTAPLGEKPIWKKIWKCNVPEKVRILFLLGRLYPTCLLQKITNYDAICQ